MSEAAAQGDATGQVTKPPRFWGTLLSWPPRRWAVAVAVAGALIIGIGILTGLVATPWFAPEVSPGPWAWPALASTGILMGLLVATYVARPGGKESAAKATETEAKKHPLDASGPFFSVGCPTCHRLVLLSFAYSGALQFFQPIHPFFALVGVLFLGFTFYSRVQNEFACPDWEDRQATAVGDVS